MYIYPHCLWVHFLPGGRIINSIFNTKIKSYPFICINAVSPLGSPRQWAEAWLPFCHSNKTASGFRTIKAPLCFPFLLSEGWVEIQMLWAKFTSFICLFSSSSRAKVMHVSGLLIVSLKCLSLYQGTTFHLILSLQSLSAIFLAWAVPHDVSCAAD